MVSLTRVVKSRERGLSGLEMVEKHWRSGRRAAEDLDQFRQDKALALLLGHELPWAHTARDFLAQFHAANLHCCRRVNRACPPS